MSQRDVSEAARLLVALERIARLAKAVPRDLLAAWLTYDAGLSKTQARNVTDSIQKLLDTLAQEGGSDGGRGED